MGKQPLEFAEHEGIGYQLWYERMLAGAAPSRTRDSCTKAVGSFSKVAMNVQEKKTRVAGP
jgi:hypothetical protein